jgi:hypothetical protein
VSTRHVARRDAGHRPLRRHVLSPDDAAFVEELEAGYDAFLDEWRREILGALAD